MEKNLYRRGLSLLLAAGVLLSCAACGAKTAAATMHLRKTEGAVGVSDGEKAIEPKENLGLYSGYGVDTQAESYAWIDLDEVKLTKLDQNSEIEITKEDKHLTIEVKSGGLFFNVTEPLAEDETLDIVTSTMMIGIRGTCGWVRGNTAALLEGEVEVTAGEQSVTITAGEMARVSGDGELVVTELPAIDVPAFVRAELDGPDAAEPKAVLERLEERERVKDQARKAALLEVLDNNGGAAYAGLFDVDGDGWEDLLLLNNVGEYYSFRWTAYLWNGSGAQAVDLNYSNDTLTNAMRQSTDDLYTVTAGVYRERDTGTLYVRYYGEVIGGLYTNYFVSTAGGLEVMAPFWGGGMHGNTEEEHEAWVRQTEQEQREYEAELERRFESLAELAVDAYEGEDYTHTLAEVRQRLAEE